MIYLIGFLLPATRSRVAGKISFTRFVVAVPLVALAIVSLHLPRAGAFPSLQMIGNCPQPICGLHLANIVEGSAKSNRLLQRRAQAVQSRAGRRMCPIIVTHPYVILFWFGARWFGQEPPHKGNIRTSRFQRSRAKIPTKLRCRFSAVRHLR